MNQKETLLSDDIQWIHARKPRINRQDRQKIRFRGSAYPKEISQQCITAAYK